MRSAKWLSTGSPVSSSRSQIGPTCGRGAHPRGADVGCHLAGERLEVAEEAAGVGSRHGVGCLHRFELIATPTGTRFTQLEHFSGLLVRFM